MINARARQVVNDLINLGYNASAIQVVSGDWQVNANSPTFVEQTVVEDFAASQSISVENYQAATEVSFR